MREETECSFDGYSRGIMRLHNMKSLRILIFDWRWWLNPAMGRAEVSTYENAKRWVKAGHEVTLFTFGAKRNVGVANSNGEICTFIDSDTYPRRD